MLILIITTNLLLHRLLIQLLSPLPVNPVTPCPIHHLPPRPLLPVPVDRRRTRQVYLLAHLLHVVLNPSSQHLSYPMPRMPHHHLTLHLQWRLYRIPQLQLQQP